MHRLSMAAAGLGVLSFCAMMEACLGSDPAPVSAQPPSNDAASLPDAIVSNDANGPREYGVFLTKELFPTNFAAGTESIPIAELVDGKCKSAASQAGLPNAEKYRALITVSLDPNGAAETERISGVRGNARPADRWCAIGGNASSRHPLCSALLGVVFANPEQFVSGPSAPLTFNEYGEPTTDQVFYSGVRWDKPPGELRIRNCHGWQNSVADASPTNLDIEMGVGLASPPEAGSPIFGWAAFNGGNCTDDRRHRLLCVEQPSD